MVAALALPRLLRRVSDRSAMLAGGLLLPAGLALAGFVDGFGALLVVWLALGVGLSLVQTPSGLLVRRSGSADERPALFAAQFSLSHACWLATYPMAGVLGSTLGLLRAAWLLAAWPPSPWCWPRTHGRDATGRRGPLVIPLHARVRNAPLHTPVDDPPLIDARGLTKRFDGRTAVDRIDVAVAGGEAFGFLGPNGAGKTSTMRMISCVSPVTAGELRVLGMDPVPRDRGSAPGWAWCPQRTTPGHRPERARQPHDYGRYFGLSEAVRGRAEELLEFVQLSKARSGWSAVRGHAAAADDRAVAGQRAGPRCCWTSRRRVWTHRPGTCCGSGCSGSSSGA